jgi:hypothetical protein
MKSYDLLQNIRRVLLGVCDKVEDTFIFPDQDIPDMFPYISILLKDIPSFSRNRGIQTLSIFGFVHGNTDILMERMLDFRDKVMNAIGEQSNWPDGVKLVIESGDNSNLFRPIGLDSGVFAPLAGFRIDCKLPFETK